MEVLENHKVMREPGRQKRLLPPLWAGTRRAECISAQREVKRDEIGQTRPNSVTCSHGEMTGSSNEGLGQIAGLQGSDPSQGEDPTCPIWWKVAWEPHEKQTGMCSLQQHIH